MSAREEGTREPVVGDAARGRRLDRTSWPLLRRWYSWRVTHAGHPVDAAHGVRQALKRAAAYCDGQSIQVWNATSIEPTPAYPRGGTST